MNRYWLTPAYEADFDAKVSDINELYKQAPELAKQGQRVEILDEMTGVQALERKHPDLPLLPGKIERREFEYIRHGTLAFIFNFDAVTGWLAALYTLVHPTNPFRQPREYQTDAAFGADNNAVPAPLPCHSSRTDMPTCPTWRRRGRSDLLGGSSLLAVDGGESTVGNDWGKCPSRRVRDCGSGWFVDGGVLAGSGVVSR